MLVDGLPLHPIVVHLPVALSMLMPLFAAGAWYAWRRNIMPQLIWVAVAALQVLLVASGVVALKTGEQEEDRVEEVVSEDRIEEHEEHAEAFVWTAAAVALVAVGAAVIKSERVKAQLMGATLAGTLVVAGLAMWTGHAGGELVYKYNAGKAYAPIQPDRPAAQPEDEDD